MTRGERGPRPRDGGRWLLLVALVALWRRRRERAPQLVYVCREPPPVKPRDPVTESPQRGVGGMALAAVFITFVPLAFSADFLDAAYDAADEVQPDWLLLAVDGALLAIVLVLGAVVRRKASLSEVGTRTWQWWFWGAVLTLSLDLGVDLPVIVVSLLYVVALAMLVAYTLKVDLGRLVSPWGRTDDVEEGWRRFRPALPLLIGTFAGYVGSQIWLEQLEPGTNWDDCTADEPPAGAVHKEYFAQLSQVIPLLLVALGIEAGFFRALLNDPAQRAMTLVTVLILVAGEALAISALPESNEGCGNVLYPLHEYSAFVITLEAAFVALAMLVLALVIAPRRDAAEA